ncbi:MAG: leucine-rich repeat protein [Paludibacteraceae bacterium]
MNLYGLSYPLDLSATPGGYAYVLYSDCDNNIATIYAASNNTYYYKFSQWSDGNTENPRTLALTEDTKLTADFTAVPFHKVVLKGYSIEGDIQYVDYNSNSVYTYDFWGNTTKNVLEGMQVIISENGSCGNWLGWSDGNTEKYDRIITITSDTVIESLFDAKSYEISITAGEGGYLSNGGFEGKIYDCDNYISRRAYPYDGYYFVGWSNGETDTYLSMDIYSDTIVVALFAEIVPASVVVAPTAACASMGTVSGGGAYNTGDYVTITATPNEGYHFVEWSDGNGRPERTFRLISDTTLYATFAAGDFGGKCGTDLYWTWDKTTKELSITGTGAMDLETYPAWKSDTYRERIDTLCRIQFADGITTIAENAFTTIDYNYPTYLVKELIIPASVGFMGYGCFRGFGGSMDRIEYLGNTAKVDGWAMAGKKVRYLKVPAGFVSELDIQDTLIITNGEASMSYSTCPYVDLSAASNTDMSRIAITYHSDVLRTYILPNDLEVIDDNALRSCRYLSAITIPAGVTYIGVSAFEDCRSMTSVTFAGNKVETIGDWAFYNCHSLRNLTLPEGVEEVGLAAFYGCTYLNELVIPSTMKKIADNGFAGCERMQMMYVNALVPPTIEAKTFEDVDRETPVFVPRGTIGLYQADEYWSEFFNMTEYDAPTGNLNTAADEAKGLRKVVRNGQVLILRGDKTYTVLGETIQ